MDAKVRCCFLEMLTPTDFTKVIDIEKVRWVSTKIVASEASLRKKDHYFAWPQKYDHCSSLCGNNKVTQSFL